MNKLAPPKRKFSPKEFAEEREYNWRRVLGHSEEIGRKTVKTEEGEDKLQIIWNKVGGIVDLKHPTQADIWWAKRFLRSVLTNPHNGDTATAVRVLTDLNKRFPDPEDKPKRRKRQKEVKRKSKKKLPFRTIAITKNLLKGTRKKLKEIENKSLYWERKLHATKISDPKWPEHMRRTNEIRSEINRLTTNVETYKLRLENLV